MVEQARRGALSRRALLKSLGLGAAAGSLLPLLRAGAQNAMYPQRLILFWTPHGTVYERWKPSGGNDLQFGPILAPLQRHRAKVNVLDGLRIQHSRVPAPPHTEGMSLIWTASHLGEGKTFAPQGFPIDWVEGPSVDQVVAQRIGSSTRFRSLELGVHAGGSSPTSRMIYAGKGKPVQPEGDPARAFDRLFAAQSAQPGADSAQALRLAKRRSVLDLVANQLGSLQTRVTREDALKIDAHLTAVRELEQRAVDRPAVCEPPMRASAQAIPDVLDRHIDMLAAALACDQTRVASIQLKFGDNDNEVYSWLGLKRGHHDVSHEGDQNAQARDDLTKIYTWYADRFAYLLDKLDAVAEGDGSLLDNTLVVWGSEIGKGNTHAFERVPFVTAGSAGGRLTTGRYLQWDDEPHNRLLVSICRTLGLADIDQFGTTDTGSGGLSGF